MITREAQSAGVSAQGAASSTRGGFVAFVGRVLLIAVVPLSLVWVPLGGIPGYGNITLGDVTLIALWAVTGWELLTGGITELDVRTPGMVLLALLLGVLGWIGSMSISGPSGSFEFFLLMKRFGMASILPLAAVLFRTRAMGPWTRASTVAGLATLAVLTAVPELQIYLPRPEGWDVDEIRDRATGLVTNPNDLAYAAVGLVILHGALVPRRPGILSRVVLLIALVAFAVCMIGSASRSGLVGAAGALTFILFSPAVRMSNKVVLLTCAVVLVIAGLSHSSEFEERVNRAYRMGRAEENVRARLDAQWTAVTASIDHPLGVGFTGFAKATAVTDHRLTRQGADSVYFETLLGAGFLGLASLLWLFRTAWKHVDQCAGPGTLRAHMLKSGILAFLLFGVASVVPMAIFLSPIFFSIVAAASYPGDDAAHPP